MSLTRIHAATHTLAYVERVYTTHTVQVAKVGLPLPRDSEALLPYVIALKLKDVKTRLASSCQYHYHIARPWVVQQLSIAFMHLHGYSNIQNYEAEELRVFPTY